MNPRLVSFVGGAAGAWRVVSINTLAGDPLADVQRLDVRASTAPSIDQPAAWTLRGVTSNERYVTRSEKDHLVSRQPSLGRPDATCAALIPLRKTAAWWALTQDERRRIFEDDSRHIATGLRYLPAVARRLHHCRDLGDHEPFDFLTWFEYARADARAFDALVAELRASAEWQYVDRDIDIRLTREST
jgi:chlorite dismutase